MTLPRLRHPTPWRNTASLSRTRKRQGMKSLLSTAWHTHGLVKVACWTKKNASLATLTQLGERSPRSTTLSLTPCFKAPATSSPPCGAKRNTSLKRTKRVGPFRAKSVWLRYSVRGWTTNLPLSLTLTRGSTLQPPARTAPTSLTASVTFSRKTTASV